MGDSDYSFWVDLNYSLHKDILGEYIYAKWNEDWRQHLVSWNEFLKKRDDLKNRILGSLYENMAQFSNAIRPFLRALDFAVKDKDYATEAILCEKLGVAYQNTGDFVKANEYYERSLSRATKAKDKLTAARCYVDLGGIYRTEPKKRIKYCKKGISGALEVGDIQGQARGYTGAGIAYEDLRDLKMALQCHKKAMSLAEDDGDLAQKARSLCNIAAVYANLANDPSTAKVYAEESLCIAEKIGDQSMQMTVHIGIGTIYYNKNDFSTALIHFEKAYSLAKITGSQEGERLSEQGLKNTRRAMNLMLAKK